MMTLDTVIGAIGGLDAAELRRWIAERWVRPEPTAQGYLFHEVDVARIRLIVELRRDLAIDDEALPVVLHLLDQVYALRRRLRAAYEAIDTQPAEIRHAMRVRLGGTLAED